MMREQEIYIEAINREDPNDRRRFLDEACREDKALRERLEVLLRHQDEVGSFLENTQPTLFDNDRLTQVGPYKIREKIGEGGMGVVYVADQTEPVQRKVALKMIKPGMDTNEIIARFEAERQALAFMEHPNIARVLDAGATESGRSFFVMELVRGIPITEYCDQVKLSLRERLQLFTTACDAVQHAHQKGIIHRDIKPSNVLVTQISGKAVVKVIDFGLAKAISGQRLTDKTVYTGFMRLMGTPIYMSPEQTGLSGQDVDTRSDIYSLGVLVYELLTGVTPLDKTDIQQQAYEDLCRQIRELDAPRPSARISTLKDAQRSTIAEQRHLNPKSLGQFLHGDLDRVVMKTLEKDRDQRYQTPTDLVADIQRFLDGKPVHAVPPSPLYLARKFIRRHKVPMLTASAIFALLAMATVFSSWQAVLATRAEKIAARARTAALGATRDAEAAREQAQAAAAEMAHLLDIANLNLIQSGWEQGNHGPILELLEELKPRWKDTFEWQFWQKQMHRGLKTFFGHRNSVRGLAFSPDGEWIAAGCDDRSIRVWNLLSGEERYAPLAQCGAKTVAYSNDGRYILAGGRHNTEGKHDVICWDAETGKEEWRIPTKENIEAVSFSPDQKSIVVGGSDGIVRVYDIDSQIELFAMQEKHSNRVWAVAYTPDRTKIISVGFNDKTARIWDAADGQLLFQLDASDGLKSAALSPDGKRVVVAGGSLAEVFDVSTGACLMVLVGHEANVLGVDFSRDGHRIATASWDGTARIWDAKTGKQTHSLQGHLDGMWSVRFHPTNDSLVATASWDGTVKLWNLDDLSDPIVFNPVSDDAASPELEDETAPTPWQVSAVDFATDGQWAVISRRWKPTPEVERYEYESVIRVIDIDEQEERLSLPHPNGASAVRISPDGRWIVTGDSEGEVQVWDSRSGVQLDSRSDGRQATITKIAVSQESRIIVIGHDDGKVTAWDAVSKKELFSQQQHSKEIRAIAVSHDSRHVLTSGGDSILMWNLNGQVLHRLPCELHNAAHGLAFSPDGSRVAVISESGLRSVTCWDVTTSPWQPVSHLIGHRGNISDISFCAQGRRILTSGWDGTARLWDPDIGRQLLALESKDNSFLWRARMSDDGLRIVARASNGIQAWTLPTERQIATWQEDDRRLAKIMERP